MRNRSFRQRVNPYICAGALLTSAFSTGCTRDPHAAMLKYAKSGDEYAAAGKTAEAIIQYRNALEKEPRAGDVRLKLADAYLKEGEVAKGVQEYIRASDVVPDTTVQLRAGTFLLMARRFDDAKGRAEKVLAAEPKNVEAQVLLANALAGLKDLDGAVSELEEAIQLNPDRSATYANLGQLEMGRGRREAAEQAFKRAVELAPKSAAPHLALGSFYWATSRLVEAESELTGALQTEPDNVLALRAIATFYLATGRRDQAAPPLRRVYELTKSERGRPRSRRYLYVAEKGRGRAEPARTPDQGSQNRCDGEPAPGHHGSRGRARAGRLQTNRIDPLRGLQAAAGTDPQEYVSLRRRQAR